MFVLCLSVLPMCIALIFFHRTKRDEDTGRTRDRETLRERGL